MVQWFLNVVAVKLQVVSTVAIVIFMILKEEVLYTLHISLVVVKCTVICPPEMVLKYKVAQNKYTQIR